jgi:hypothetical protein
MQLEKSASVVHTCLESSNNVYSEHLNHTHTYTHSLCVCVSLCLCVWQSWRIVGGGVFAELFL